MFFENRNPEGTKSVQTSDSVFTCSYIMIVVPLVHTIPTLLPPVTFHANPDV